MSGIVVALGIAAWLLCLIVLGILVHLTKRQIYRDFDRYD